MPQIQKYIWVINTILNNGKITLKELNEKWKANVDLSGGLDLPRQTFDRWKGSILDLFGIIIECERRGGYKYYIENPEVLENGGTAQMAAGHLWNSRYIVKQLKPS